MKKLKLVDNNFFEALLSDSNKVFKNYVCKLVVDEW